MRQLSVYMAKHNRTKLPQRTTSTLFASDNRSNVDVFFSDGLLEKAARAAIPVRISGGFLTFIHKTIMEHSVAVAVVEGLDEAVAASGLTSEKLIEVCGMATLFVVLWLSVLTPLPLFHRQCNESRVTQKKGMRHLAVRNGASVLCSCHSSKRL